MKNVFALLLCTSITGLLYGQTKIYNAPVYIGDNGNMVNIYGDTTKKIPDSLNCMANYLEDRKGMIAVSPLQGTWTTMFVIYPDTFNHPNQATFLNDCRGGGMKIEDGYGKNTVYFFYKNKRIDATFESMTNSLCKKDIPYCIPLPNPNCFFIFGDCIECKDESKWFVYDYGKIYWLKKDKNFTH